MASIARKLRELREQRGMSLRDLAKKAGVSQTAVWHIEAGKTEKPSAETLQKLARALGVNVYYFLDEDRTLHKGNLPEWLSDEVKEIIANPEYDLWVELLRPIVEMKEQLGSPEFLEELIRVVARAKKQVQKPEN